MSIEDRVKNQRVRVSMNVKHLCVRSADTQLVQLQNGQYRELNVDGITFHREGENNSSPWTRFYDMSKPKDAEAINALRAMLDDNPHLVDDVSFRIRIAGEFDSNEPWPGYDDQDAEQVIAYYHACPPQMRPVLENIMQYELDRETPDPSKVVAIESLDKSQEAEAKKAAGAGVKL